MDAQLEVPQSGPNPLDSVEDIMSANNWSCSRMTDDELMVQVAGRTGSYRLFFIWQEDLRAMQFCCQYDLNVARDNMETAGAALMRINENLWMGHFDIPRDTRIPSFRHTCLFRGMNGKWSPEHIEDLVDISLAQCERYYAAFHLLAHPGAAGGRDLSLALMDISGEA